MALLALTLALLAMTVATRIIKEKPLDMALDSFDDQYQGCGPAMKEALPALHRSEFQKNPRFAKYWSAAVAEWQKLGSPVSPLSSSDQAIAIRAYTSILLHVYFNDKVRVAGHSPQEYRDNFHFKTLHFLLTDALATLRAAQGQQCHLAFLGEHFIRYKAKPGDIVRFGEFALASRCNSSFHTLRTPTVFKVQTCHSADINAFTGNFYMDEVVIPPFEKFKVTKVIEDVEKVEIHLNSFGTYSKYNCEWLTGGSIPRTPFHIGGLLLATTTLVAATGIL
ncbi:erythroblast NAD(P)(+)--arginine ADP-ribosyltransferase-like [Catharus ustulatus]|uniref:erythroblast NAD(P)(+)--arginine ADP-ribosyltransferase-like n=1 Tax=Catharus ustulatus TaxID=91951 RepID=UPI00140BC784|nr:erythroblast NAD(P)(+)--arginine ADP-ribosyltransferase-like [Catharus ustulatus]